MEKLLDAGSWARLASSVGPALLSIISIALLLGLQSHVGGDGVNQWCAGLALVLGTLVWSSLIDELSGRVEARFIDRHGYPYFRARALRRKWKKSLDAAALKERHVERYDWVWQRYLDIVLPAERSIRWAYYETLVQRYKTSVGLGVGCLLSAILWFLGPLASWTFDIRHDTLTTAADVCVGGALLSLGVFLVAFEASSSAAILHYHRIRLLRGIRI